MGLVNEQQHRQRRLLHRVDDVFQALLELTFNTCPRLQQAEVEGAHAYSLQRFRHIAVRNTQRQSFHEGRLTDARLADQDRVVLAAT